MCMCDALMISRLECIMNGLTAEDSFTHWTVGALLCCVFCNVFAPTLLSPDVALAKLAVSLHRGVIGLRQGCQRSGDQVRVRILASRHLPTSQTIPHKHASLAPEHLMIIEVMFFNSDLWLPQWFLTMPDLMMLNQIGRDYGSFEKSIAIRTWNFSVQGLWQCLQNQMCVLPIEWTRPALPVVTVTTDKKTQTPTRILLSIQ